MKIIFIGDVNGRVGRRMVTMHLPSLREKHKADFCVVNGENSAGGFGITEENAETLFEAGADVITSGNHICLANNLYDGGRHGRPAAKFVS